MKNCDGLSTRRGMQERESLHHNNLDHEMSARTLRWMVACGCQPGETGCKSQHKTGKCAGRVQLELLVKGENIGELQKESKHGWYRKHTHICRNETSSTSSQCARLERQKVRVSLSHETECVRAQMKT
jgi:hypothetical protein